MSYSDISSYTAVSATPSPEALRAEQLIQANSRKISAYFGQYELSQLTLNQFEDKLFGELGFIRTPAFNRLLSKDRIALIDVYRALRAVDETQFHLKTENNARIDHLKGFTLNPETLPDSSVRKRKVEGLVDHVGFIDTHIPDNFVLPAATEDPYEQIQEYARLLSINVVSIVQFRMKLEELGIPFSQKIDTIINQFSASNIFPFSQFVNALNEVLNMPRFEQQPVNNIAVPGVLREPVFSPSKRVYNNANRSTVNFITWEDDKPQQTTPVKNTSRAQLDHGNLLTWNSPSNSTLESEEKKGPRQWIY
ncbi:hypothetical protein PCE1_000714 [Barthelona sp. PCE]